MLYLSILRDDAEKARELILRDDTLHYLPLTRHAKWPEYPLCFALRRKCSLHMISALAQKGACAEGTFGDKASPLWMFVEDGYATTIQSPARPLFAFKTDTESDTLRRVSVLLRAGADSEKRDKQGRLVADVLEDQGLPRCALLIRHWHMLLPVAMLRSAYEKSETIESSNLLALPESAIRLICLQVAPCRF